MNWGARKAIILLCIAIKHVSSVSQNTLSESRPSPLSADSVHGRNHEVERSLLGPASTAVMKRERFTPESQQDSSSNDAFHPPRNPRLQRRSPGNGDQQEEQSKRQGDANNPPLRLGRVRGIFSKPNEQGEVPKNKNSINVGQGGEQSHSSVRIGTAPQPQDVPSSGRITSMDNSPPSENDPNRSKGPFASFWKKLRPKSNGGPETPHLPSKESKDPIAESRLPGVAESLLNKGGPYHELEQLNQQLTPLNVHLSKKEQKKEWDKFGRTIRLEDHSPIERQRYKEQQVKSWNQMVLQSKQDRTRTALTSAVKDIAPEEVEREIKKTRQGMKATAERNKMISSLKASGDRLRAQTNEMIERRKLNTIFENSRSWRISGSNKARRHSDSLTSYNSWKSAHASPFSSRNDRKDETPPTMHRSNEDFSRSSGKHPALGSSFYHSSKQHESTKSDWLSLGSRSSAKERAESAWKYANERAARESQARRDYRREEEKRMQAWYAQQDSKEKERARRLEGKKIRDSEGARTWQKADRARLEAEQWKHAGDGVSSRPPPTHSEHNFIKSEMKGMKGRTDKQFVRGVVPVRAAVMDSKPWSMPLLYQKSPTPPMPREFRPARWLARDMPRKTPEQEQAWQKKNQQGVRKASDFITAQGHAMRNDIADFKQEKKTLRRTKSDPPSYRYSPKPQPKNNDQDTPPSFLEASSHRDSSSNEPPSRRISALRTTSSTANQLQQPSARRMRVRFSTEVESEAAGEARKPNGGSDISAAPHTSPRDGPSSEAPPTSLNGRYRRPHDESPASTPPRGVPIDERFDKESGGPFAVGRQMMQDQNGGSPKSGDLSGAELSGGEKSPPRR